MRRIIYDVQRAGAEKQEKRSDPQVWVTEKRSIALKLISNASVLSDAVTTFRSVLEKNPDADLKVAVAKIDKVIEDLKMDFKKTYKL